MSCFARWFLSLTDFHWYCTIYSLYKSQPVTSFTLRHQCTLLVVSQQCNAYQLRQAYQISYTVIVSIWILRHFVFTEWYSVDSTFGTDVDIDSCYSHYIRPWDGLWCWVHVHPCMCCSQSLVPFNFVYSLVCYCGREELDKSKKVIVKSKEEIAARAAEIKKEAQVCLELIEGL